MRVGWENSNYLENDKANADVTRLSDKFIGNLNKGDNDTGGLLIFIQK